MPTEAETRAALVREARTWLGTPYAPYGRTKGTGADCIFLEEVARAVLGTGKRYRNYSLLPRDRLIERHADRDLVLIACNCAEPCEGCARRGIGPGIRFEDLKPGRLALFTGRNPDEPQHFGMLARHPKFPEAVSFLHAMGRETSGGKVVEVTLTSRAEWRRPAAFRSFTRRLHKLYDFPGVAHVG